MRWDVRQMGLSVVKWVAQNGTRLSKPQSPVMSARGIDQDRTGQDMTDPTRPDPTDPTDRPVNFLQVFGGEDTSPSASQHGGLPARSLSTSHYCLSEANLSTPEMYSVPLYRGHRSKSSINASASNRYGFHLAGGGI